MKIVIAGGGTAGWLSALFISTIYPEFEVVLIESSKIGVIGTGEGSTGLLNDVLTNRIWNFGCNLEDFLKTTKSTPKLGIEFSNWGVDDYISPIDGSAWSSRSPDNITLHAIANNLPSYITSAQGVRGVGMMTQFNDQENIKRAINGGAYHFDGQLVSQYFKSICDTVKIYDDKITSFKQRSNGSVSTITCENIVIDDIDMVIDCLGFNSIFNKELPSEFIDFSKHLPVNTAIPFQLENNDLANTIPFTKSRAMNYGWMWQIPVGKRYGCGYVFNGDLLSPEDAVEEIENTLQRKITPIKTIKFTSGHIKQLWRKNVVAIGLSSGFLEPLQATAIHTVIAHLSMLCFDFLNHDKRLVQNYPGRDLYNVRAGQYYHDFADFINLHYQTPREDTEFWKYMKYNSATDFVKNIVDVCRARIPTHHDFNKYNYAAGASIWNPTIHALGILSPATAKKQLNFCQKKFFTNVKSTLETHLSIVQSENLLSVEEFYEIYSKYY